MRNITLTTGVEIGETVKFFFLGLVAMVLAGCKTQSAGGTGPAKGPPVAILTTGEGNLTLIANPKGSGYCLNLQTRTSGKTPRVNLRSLKFWTRDSASGAPTEETPFPQGDVEPYDVILFKAADGVTWRKTIILDRLPGGGNWRDLKIEYSNSAGEGWSDHLLTLGRTLPSSLILPPNASRGQKFTVLPGQSLPSFVNSAGATYGSLSFVLKELELVDSTPTGPESRRFRFHIRGSERDYFWESSSNLLESRFLEPIVYPEDSQKRGAVDSTAFQRLKEWEGKSVEILGGVLPIVSPEGLTEPGWDVKGRRLRIKAIHRLWRSQEVSIRKLSRYEQEYSDPTNVVAIHPLLVVLEPPVPGGFSEDDQALMASSRRELAYFVAPDEWALERMLTERSRKADFEGSGFGWNGSLKVEKGMTPAQVLWIKGAPDGSSSIAELLRTKSGEWHYDAMGPYGSASIVFRHGKVSEVGSIQGP